MPHAWTATICVYTEDRWPLIEQAIESLYRQTLAPVEVLVVVDHNEALRMRLCRAYPGARIVANRGPKGLSGARNTALEACSTPFVAFLDDDATAEPGWAESLLAALAAHDAVVVGSAVRPRFETRRSAWLTPEFDWTVGCSYRGLPTAREQVRNVFGCAMVLDVAAARAVGGFSEDLGRVGNDAAGCEETELCLRMHSRLGAPVVYEPAVAIEHFVPAARVSFRYFLGRCRAEGRSKAAVAELARRYAHRPLQGERDYVVKALPRGLVRECRQGNWLGAVGICVGLAATASSYLGAIWRQPRRRAS